MILIFGVVFAVIATSSDVDSTDSTDTTSESSEAEDEDEDDDSTYTPEALDETLTYYADIEVEDYGTITIELDQESAPITAANFVELAESGFYNGLTFHRIIEGFMMQGGDPNGDGTGGSDNTIVGEFTDNGYDNELSHTRGAVSMARSTDYDSASSQFFIVQEDISDSLDGQYAVFGYVTEGMDIVDEICEAAEPTDDNGTIEAEDQPVITSVTIYTEEAE
ncbi:MAG: peptidylprolyl isomerase [Ruminococcus sp.]|nr:peptidylprolyl isomerase [Ruminococcus sp.]